MDLNRLVWVTVGKTDHQAWLVDDNTKNAKASSGEEDTILVQWDVARFNEWVPRSAVRQGMPSRRRCESLVPRTALLPETAAKSKGKGPLSRNDNPRNDNPKSKVGETGRRKLQIKKRPRPSRSAQVEGSKKNEESSETQPFFYKRTKVEEREEPVATETICISTVKRSTRRDVAASSILESKSLPITKRARTENIADEHEGSIFEQQAGCHEEVEEIVLKPCAVGASNDGNVREENEVEAEDKDRNRSDVSIKVEIGAQDVDGEGEDSWTKTQQRVFHELLTGQSLFTPKSEKSEIRRHFFGEKQDTTKGDFRLTIVDRTPDSSMRWKVSKVSPDDIFADSEEIGVGQDLRKTPRAGSDCGKNGDCVSESGASSVPTLNSLSSSTNAVDEILNSPPRADVKCGSLAKDRGTRVAGEESFEDSILRDVQQLASSSMQLVVGPHKNLLLLASVLDFLPHDS